MATGQQWLFAPARPLVERLGKEFFRKAPAQPGVYLMRDGSGVVVYVGKAKNLRQRLRSYRVANAERVPRRHLRLMREVQRIDFDLCRTESAALTREAKLLRELKPKFNRAGVWPAQAAFLTWRFADHTAVLSVHEVPPVGWERFGSLGACAPRLLASVVRLLWLALNPQASFSRLPHGWAHNRFALPVTIVCGVRENELRQVMVDLCWGEPEKFLTWVMASTEANASAFERTAMRADLEQIEGFIARHRKGRANSSQLVLL